MPAIPAIIIRPGDQARPLSGLDPAGGIPQLLDQSPTPGAGTNLLLQKSLIQLMGQFLQKGSGQLLFGLLQGITDLVQGWSLSLLEKGPLSESCTYLSYDAVREVSRLKHLAHLSDSVLDEYAEEAE